jgi:hypothetical protein
MTNSEGRMTKEARRPKPGGFGNLAGLVIVAAFVAALAGREPLLAGLLAGLAVLVVSETCGDGK